MFDNKTAQVCFAGPVETDDGKHALEIAIQKYKEKHPSGENPLSGNVLNAFLNAPEVSDAQDRVKRLQDHPEEMKVRVNGLRYCADLMK